jgi:hypothetical protein
MRKGSQGDGGGVHQDTRPARACGRMPPWRQETNRDKKLSGAEHPARPARNAAPVSF